MGRKKKNSSEPIEHFEKEDAKLESEQSIEQVEADQQPKEKLSAADLKKIPSKFHKFL